MAREFDINILMDLCKQNRYAMTVGGFEVIDMTDQIELPKRIRRAKPSVRAMHILGHGIAKWDYISEERRAALREELGLNPPTAPEESNTAPAATANGKETKKA